MRVTTHDGTSYSVPSVAAFDPAFDLVVLRVPGVNVPALALGDSDAVRQGEAVLALGNPLGFEATLSTGIVSARREFSGGYVLQTTAAISPGSSGGPLLNSRGEVVGVTTLLAEGGQNVNFAVPSIYVKRLLEATRGQGYSMEEFASRTRREQESDSAAPSATTSPERQQASFPESVAGFPFGITRSKLGQLCPEASHDLTTAHCPYALIGLPFAKGGVDFVLSYNAVTAIVLVPTSRHAAEAALVGKYGVPRASLLVRKQWQTANQWPVGKPGAMQWDFPSGSRIRLGSLDGKALFLTFVSRVYYSVQRDNY